MLSETTHRPKRIVGIGASAGGLEALEKFFNSLSPNTGNCFVVIQHLSPDFKSVMDELLSRQTGLPIRHVENGLVLQANTIYLNPPKTDLRIDNGAFRLIETIDQRSPLFPIDQFFVSLAEHSEEHAVAIVLSGTGSDGTRGVMEIKKKGGTVLVQDPVTAKFDGMPKGAINTRVVDFVGSPAELATWFMPRELQAIHGDDEKAAVDPQEQIFEFIRQQVGIDFKEYKPATILRRMERRYQLSKVKGPAEYLTLLKAEGSEVHLLVRDLLIEVTEFFRDTEAFGKLQESAIVPMIESGEEKDEFRVWVAGCATGEEAYSIAILFHEELRKQNKRNTVKIFATDIHRQSIAVASEGVYTLESLTPVSKELRERYFEEVQDGWRVSSTLRNSVVFAEHNILRNPPFTRIDMISCRNMLIYFEPEAQERIIHSFAYALRTDGILFLGNSETVGRLDKAFETIDRVGRVYKRLDFMVPPLRNLGHDNQPKSSSFMPSKTSAIGPRWSKSTAQTNVYQQLLNQYIPTGFLIRDNFVLLHVFGTAGQFLRYQGPAPVDILGMLPGELRIAVSTATQRALRQNSTVLYGNVDDPSEGATGRLRVIVDPLPEERKGERYLMIRLETEATAAANKVPVESVDFDASEAIRERIEELEKELEHSRANLQATVEELETSNEELQATNEEMLASNEELQSTNEELQSVNEELFSVNAEFE